MFKPIKFLIAVFGFLFAILFIFIVLLMIYVKKTDAIVLNEDLTCQYREVVYADQFIKEVDGTLLDRYLIDTSVIGKRRVEIQFKNRYGFVEHKKFYVTVQDVVAPTNVVSNPYEVVVGEVSNLLDHIFCADDYDDGISCVIDGIYNLNQEGRYPLSIYARDKSGNENKRDFILDVVSKASDSKKNSNADINFRDVYQKYYKDGYDVGVDLSKWQGAVDFNRIFSSGVSFVMLKVGEQSDIGGRYSIDPNFEEYAKKANELGLKIGVYFKSKARNESEAKRQAKWVIQTIKKYDISLPVAFDWENWDQYSKFKIGFRTLNSVSKSYISEINRYGYVGMLYSSKYYFNNIWYRDEYSSKWIADYAYQGSYPNEYMMWQVSNQGRIDGIDGYVDIDVLKTK